MTPAPAPTRTPDLRRGRHDSGLDVRDGVVRFVKRGCDRQGRDSLGRERLIFRALAACPAELTSYLVPLVSSGAAELVFEATADDTFAAAYRQGRGSEAVLAAAVGEAIATVHTHGPVDRIPLCRARPERPIHQPSPVLLSQLSPGQVALVGLIQRSAELCASLSGTNRAARTHFTHGDLRWENILVGDGTSTIRIIDWEYAGVGDPFWDLGCFVADALGAWIDGGADDPSEATTLIDAFLNGYRRRNTGLTDGHHALLGNVFRAAAVRLVHRSLETVVFLEHVPPPAAVRLQLADNILRDPIGAGIALATCPSREQKVGTS